MATSMRLWKLAAIIAFCSTCLLAGAQSKPKAAAHTKVSIAEKMKASEAKFAQMAANSGKASAQLDKISTELDQLIKTLHDFHVRIAKP